MPEIDGTELSHRIRNQSSCTKIAVMSGGDADVAIEIVNNWTVDYFFKKPFTLNHVCTSLIAEHQMIGP